MSRFRVFPPQFESVRGRMTSSEADQPPVTGVSLITLVRRATSALLSQLFKKDRGLTMVSPAPGVRERKGRVTPLYRRRRSLPSYLGKVSSKSLPAELLIKLSGFGATPSSRGGGWHAGEAPAMLPDCNQDD